MIKPTGPGLAILMAATTAGTYFGLEALPRGLIPPPIGRVAAVEPAPVSAPARPVVVAAAASPAPAASAEPAAAPETVSEPPAPVTIQARAAPEPVAAAPANAAVEPAAAEPTPQAASAPTEAPAETAAAAPATPVREAPEADVLKPWWPDPSTMPANQLKLQYAGQVKGQPAIALLFSAPVQIGTVQDHAIVRNAAGETVAGVWGLGKRADMAIFSGLPPGRYTVILNPEIADQKGFMLGTTLTGPVYVQGP